MSEKDLKETGAIVLSMSAGGINECVRTLKEVLEKAERLSKFPQEGFKRGEAPEIEELVKVADINKAKATEYKAVIDHLLTELEKIVLPNGKEVKESKDIKEAKVSEEI